MSVGENDEVDQDFLSGFNKETSEISTTTPMNDDDSENTLVEVESKAQEPEPDAKEDGDNVKQNEQTAELETKEPEFKISKADYEALLAKAAAVDELRAEQKQIKDTAFGRIGGLQQIINELQSSTKRGQKVQVTTDHFKELVDEGYEDLAGWTAQAFNRILSELDVSGTGGNETNPVSQDEIKRIFEQRFTPERESLKAELRAEMAAETLSDLHEDWRDVVKSDTFQSWAKENKVNDLKDRYGVPFAESIDAKFVAKQIGAYKENLAKLQAAKQKQAARQNRIESAVQPKGSGGLSQAQSDEDDFYVGFKRAQT